MKIFCFWALEHELLSKTSCFLKVTAHPKDAMSQFKPNSFTKIDSHSIKAFLFVLSGVHFCQKRPFPQRYSASKPRHEPIWTNFFCVNWFTQDETFLILASRTSTFLSKTSRFLKVTANTNDVMSQFESISSAKIASHRMKAFWIWTLERPLLSKTSRFLKSTAYPKDAMS